MTGKLVRPLSGRMLAGVCAGVARYLKVDPTIVRLALVVAAFVWSPSVILYLLAWIIMPEEGSA